MFDIIKQKVNLLEKLGKDLDVTFKPMGDKNWVIDADKDVEGCPFCGHHDCFRVSHTEGDNSSSFYKCFSCGEYGDVVSWVAKRKDISLGDAIRDLAKEYNVTLPVAYNPVQQVFSLAATYYHNCLIETCNKPYPKLAGKTPLGYQTEVRRHKPETLTKFKVGFSDGGLAEYLEAIGIDEEILLASGLVRKEVKYGTRDFLPAGCFIYPHFVNGRVSHFTFKDPLKKVQYQLPKKYSLNGYLFYGQDTFEVSDPLILVEGENDRLSVMETGKVGSCMAIIGQISGEQLTWLRENCRDKIILTIFDPDSAGDKYRQSVEAIRKYFKGLAHVVPPDDKDIDEHLTGGADFQELIQSNIVKVVLEEKLKPAAPSLDIEWPEGAITGGLGPTPPSSPPSSPPLPLEETPETGREPESSLCEPLETGSSTPTAPYVPPIIPGAFNQPGGPSSSNQEVEEEPIHTPGPEDGPITEFRGAYYKTVYKDGIPKSVQISDFVIKLLNIYIPEKGDREREVVIIRKDGFKSEPFIVTSEVKVSLKPFKVLVAKMADAKWLGKDADLDNMWDIVYSAAPSAIVRVTKKVGWHAAYKCWIFRNVLITASGVVIHPDENGIFWTQGKSQGIKPADLNIKDEGKLMSVPAIETSLSREEARALLQGVLENLAANLGSIGDALIAIGWLKANVYSDLIYKINRGMSMLLLWSGKGEGKGTIVNWFREFFGFHEEIGRATPSLLKTGVGFMRQAAYYASVPLFLDELRQDEESLKYLGMLRSWYDRDDRAMGTRESFGISTQGIVSTLIIAGEDLPADPATRERCISLLIRSNESEQRETVKTYAWMQRHLTMFSNISYYWILDSCNVDEKDVVKGIGELDTILKDAGCTSRTSKNWAASGYFANQLAQEFFPEFDFLAYMKEASGEEQTSQREDSTLTNFLEQVETIMSAEQPKISTAHVIREGNEVHIWLAGVYNIVTREMGNRKTWSRNALRRDLKNKTYFVSDTRKVSMGNGVRQVVMTFDLDKAPDIIKNIARAND